MPSPPSTEQLLVQVSVRTMDEVLAAMAEPGADHGEGVGPDEALALAFAPLWHRLPRLDLRCMSDGIWWKGTRVLATDESGSTLVDTLVSSGIQSLTLEPGAEEEIRHFLELVDEKARRDEHAERDLLMMLFRADLHHVTYSITPPDELATRPVDTVAVPETDPGRLRSAVRADAAETEDRRVVRLEKFDSTLYFLDQPEIEHLRFEVDRQYEQDHTRSVLALLLDTLQMRREPAVRDEVIAALRAFLPYLLGSGRFTSLAYLTAELRKVVRGTEVEPRHRAALDEIRLAVSEKGALTQLFLALESGRMTPTAEGLGMLLRELDHAALETVLVWAGQLQREDVKAALVTALQELYREWPDHLVRSLGSEDRTVVQRALAMAGRLRLPDLVEGAAGPLRHEDAAVRKLAVRVLASIGGTPAMREVARGFEDPDSGVRKAAYQAFLDRPYRSAAKRLREVLASADIESLDLSERKLLFATFGAVAGPGGVSDLEPVLAGKRGLVRKPSSETRACAALGLEQIDSREARSALEAAATYRDPLVRSAAAAALRGKGR